LSFDPTPYEAPGYGTDYYTLWHYRRGQWVNYGKLPHQDIVYYTMARPFQIKLEQDKYGLKAGWHILFLQSLYEEGNLHQQKILRLRHVGQRIAEGQDGYKDPEYMNEDWETIDTKYLDPVDDPWYSGVAISGRGVYHPKFGIVFESDRRGQSYYDWDSIYPDAEYPDVTHIDINIHCWDETFYSIVETSTTHGHVASPIMGYISPWPGTFNTLLGAHYQANTNNPDWPDKNVLFFNPENRNTDQPWFADPDAPSYDYPWLINENIDYPRVNIWRWQSNFWFCCSPLTMIWWQAPYMSGEESGYYPAYNRAYAIYQGPYHWRSLNNTPGEEWLIGPRQLEDSIWDWAEDGSCAESDFKYAYVRRISDGSIWRFRNWNQSTGVYTDFPNLAMRPTEPVLGVEYASFFMNGPPIPGNETWNTLMILK